MDIKKDAWDNFISAMDFDSDDKNFIYDFKVMTKKYGQAYIAYCRAMWEANEGVQSEDEFMKMNAEMPRAFFEKAIRGK
tara:strand:- start:395 stop:631 length:237 start_codon:yes stop_codon:yes gene_type:complete